MEHFSGSNEKSYTSLSEEERDALPLQERATAYRQMIDYFEKGAAQTPNEGRYWSCVERIQEYEQKLTVLEAELK